jgi:hypothetical protein
VATTGTDYLGSPTTSATAIHNSAKSARVSGVHTLVLAVLPMTGQPQVGAAIVEFVAIDVVNLEANRATHNQSMHRPPNYHTVEPTVLSGIAVYEPPLRALA